MQDIPREQIIKRFQTLPESLQNEIFSERSADTIIKHCALRDVPDDKMPIVGRLSTRVLLGYLRPELFALEIQKETGMDMQKAQLIAHDLDMEIFSAVRLELKKLYPPTIQTPTVQSWRAESAAPSFAKASEGKQELPAKPRYVIPIPEKFLRQTTDNKPEEKSNIPRPDLQQPINQSAPIAGSKTNSSSDILESAGGGQVSQIAKEVIESPAAEARPQKQAEVETQKSASGGTASRQAETKSPAEALPQARPDLKQTRNVASPDFQQRESTTTPDQAQRQTSQQPAELSGRKPGLGNNTNPASGGQASEKPQENLQPATYNLQPNSQPAFKPIVPLPTFIQTRFDTTQVDPQKSESQKEGAANAPLADDPQIKSIISKFSMSSTQKPKPPGESPYREKV